MKLSKAINVPSTTLAAAVALKLEDPAIGKVTAERGHGGSWVVSVYGPRGGLLARGYDGTWLEATRRALQNLDEGVKP